MKKILAIIKAVWYGKVGEDWWRETDKLCGKNATVEERLEATRDYL